MTFRSRILQAILGIVVVTTAASLFVAQRQNSASYQAVVDELLHDQTAAFQREHEARLDVAERGAQRAAMSVRLFAALEGNDPEVYKIASDELRLDDFTFYRLLDASGRLIPPPADGRAGRLDFDRIHGALAPADLSSTAGQVQVGFIDEATPDVPAGHVYRVLATPIANFDERVGTLILGQRVGSARPGAAAAALTSGLLIDGRLAGGDLSKTVRDALERVLATSDHAEGGTFHVGGDTYRYQLFQLNADSSYPPAYLVSAFSLQQFQSQQRRLIVRIVLIGAAALVVAALVGLAIARQLSRPVGALVAATERIRRGDYQLELPSSTTEEMNTLAESFNDMAAGLALRDRYQSVLMQVADAQVADELVAGHIKLGGELREVTVLFCDIRDYTSITVGRNPEAVIGILNQHLGALTDIVQAHKGVVNQFAGDSIMALFGAPKRYGNEARRAIDCARQMMLARRRLNRESSQPLEVGIGIATGALVAGCIGSERRSDYTVVGERVNLAARLCAIAKAGQILIDDETHRQVASDFACHPVPGLALKGFAARVTAYDVAVAEVPA
jgi:class 3 adenylate cyclase